MRATIPARPWGARCRRPAARLPPPPVLPAPLARANLIELCIEVPLWNDPYGMNLIGSFEKEIEKKGAWMKKYVID